MGVFDASAGLPEFFSVDVRFEELPGGCLRAVFHHPTEGEVVAVIIPFTCWLEMRLKAARFTVEHDRNCREVSGTSIAAH